MQLKIGWLTKSFGKYSSSDNFVHGNTKKDKFHPNGEVWLELSKPIATIRRKKSKSIDWLKLNTSHLPSASLVQEDIAIDPSYISKWQEDSTIGRFGRDVHSLLNMVLKSWHDIDAKFCMMLKALIQSLSNKELSLRNKNGRFHIIVKDVIARTSSQPS